MAIESIQVFLPCQTLDGFPATLEEDESEDLLAAWTAAWHPGLLAAAGTVPAWASVDLPPASVPTTLEIVPAALDSRFAGQADATVAAGPRVRGVRGREQIVAAALAAGGLPAASLDAELEAEFVALGLATLLAEVLARRMRSAANLEASGFGADVVTAARAATAGRTAEAIEAIRSCYVHLETARARYYPVDFWVLDLVLLAEATLGPPLRAEVASPAPLGIVASGATVAALAARHPDSLAAVRAAVAAGRVTLCGGRDDDTPALDALAAEGVLGSLRAGQAVWREQLGTGPTVYAARAGCASPLLPQLLGQLGYVGAIWSSFDGSRLPEPHAGLVRWEGAGGSLIDAVARRPVDVRTTAAILGLPERISDALDHDHTPVLTLAHYAGTASRWLAPLRLAASRSTCVGTFVAPEEFFRRSGHVGTTMAFVADDFPPTRPPAAPHATGAASRDPTGAASRDPIAVAIDAAVREAEGIVAARAALSGLLRPAPIATPAAALPRGDGRRGLWSRLVGRSRSGRDDLLLDNGLVHLRAHRESGGILALRRPTDRGNRVSQQIAIRSTSRSTDPARPWSMPEDVAEYTRMRADTVARLRTAAGSDCIESHGRLVSAAGAEVGSFVQRMALVAGAPVALLDVEVRLAATLEGPPLDHHVACRFAWNENDDVRIRRSLHAQGVETSRGWFTAPHFVNLERQATRGPEDVVTILTGGLPWHTLAAGHVLDSILLLPGGSAATRRLAIGLDLERPWDAAFDFLVGRIRPAAVDVPDNLRLTAAALEPTADGTTRVRVGLLESAGRAGEVRIGWAAEPIRAAACTADGRSRDDSGVRIDGRTTAVHLGAHEWLHLDVEFHR